MAARDPLANLQGTPPPPVVSVRVGFALAPSDPFWVQVREAAKQRAAELGIDLVRLPVLPNARQGDDYLGTLENLRALELRALISNAATPSYLLAILNEGLPIVCSEETALIHPRLVSVRGLGRAAGLAADLLAERLHGRGNILLAGGLEDHLETTRTRVRGFQDALARYPDITCAHVLTVWPYEDAFAQLLDDGETLHSLFPSGHIDAIFGISDPVALAARDACRRLGLADAATLVAGVNGDPLAIAAIEAGTMVATVDTDPQVLGRNLAEFALRAVEGEPLPNHFDYHLTLVTAANVSQVAARRLVALADLPSRLVNVNRLQEEERLRQLHASLEMNRSIGAIVEWKELSRTLAEIIRSRYGYDHMQLFRWSAEDQALLPADEGTGWGRDERRGAAGGARPIEATILAAALLRNQPIYVPDTQNSPRFPSDPTWPHTRARVVLPIRFAGRTIGVLDLHSSRRTVRTAAELDALQALADQLGGALQNALLYDQALSARAEAEESNRMRARLLANLSHGLRGPLNVILGYVQSALAEPSAYVSPLPTSLRQDLRLIQQSGVDLLRLVNELLDLAQAESGLLPLYPEHVEMTSLLAELFRGAERMLGGAPGIEWRLQVPDLLPALDVDAVRLRNVLLTLLSNAARFTTAGTIVLGAAASDGELCIWVQDTGSGIAPERLAQLNADADGRSPGESAPGHGGSSQAPIGLGLGIARHLVRLMGGRLQIDSRLDEGTLCQVILPCAPEQNAAVEPESALAPAPAPVAPAGAPYRLTLDRAPTLVKQGVEYIETHYAEPFGRNDLARVLGISPTYVSRVFQRELGLSPWDYLTRVRIDHARALLRAPSSAPVAEVALRVGFTDPAYFARTFRRYTGRSPQEYRARRDSTPLPE